MSRVKVRNRPCWDMPPASTPPPSRRWSRSSPCPLPYAAAAWSIPSKSRLIRMGWRVGVGTGLGLGLGAGVRLRVRVRVRVRLRLRLRLRLGRRRRRRLMLRLRRRLRSRLRLSP